MSENKEKQAEGTDLSLYGWLFTFNPYRGLWFAYKRDTKYFEGEGPVDSDKDINKLIETIKNKANDDSNR